MLCDGVGWSFPSSHSNYLSYGLPGMSGYEVAAAVRANSQVRDCLLIAVTGYGQEQDRKQSRIAGFNYHLVKPVDFQLLQQLIGQWQATHPAAPSSP